MENQIKAAWISVASNVVLMVSKVTAGIMIGSISIISEAIHSANDLLASFIALFAVRQSSKPPDKEHPYGHGKVENVSGTVEAMLIFVAAVVIIKEAIEKLQHGSQTLQVGWGIAVMGGATLINLLVSQYLLKVGRETDSVAIEADGMHLRTDVYTSAGVFLGLILISFTGWTIIDPIAAIIVAVLIIKTAWELTRKAFLPLVDTALDEDKIMIIESILKEQSHKFFEYHELRTRKAGRESHIDLHLVVSPDKSIKEAHELCDIIEKNIHQQIPYAQVLIHVEPVEEKKVKED